MGNSKPVFDTTSPGAAPSFTPLAFYVWGRRYVLDQGAPLLEGYGSPVTVGTVAINGEQLPSWDQVRAAFQAGFDHGVRSERSGVEMLPIDLSRMVNHVVEWLKGAARPLAHGETFGSGDTGRAAPAVRTGG